MKGCRRSLALLLVLAALGGMLWLRKGAPGHPSVRAEEARYLELALQDCALPEEAILSASCEHFESPAAQWVELVLETAEGFYRFSMDAATGEIYFKQTPSD